MKRFEHREIREAIAYAEGGGQALHVWDPGPGGWPGAPAVFQRNRPWAHLFDYDRERLIRTATSLGVRVIKVDSDGKRGQHIDLCGKPLKKAIGMCVKKDTPEQGELL